MHYNLDPPKVLLSLRLAVPLLCFAELIDAPKNSGPAFGIGLLALFDVLWCFWKLHRRTTVTNSCVRDGLYALAFYILYISTPTIPGLILAPVAVAEGAYWFAAVNIKALALGLLLIAFRMWSLHRLMHTFPHPVWPVLMSLTLIIASLFGYFVRQLTDSRQKFLQLYGNITLAMNELTSALDVDTAQPLVYEILAGGQHIKEQSHQLALILKKRLAASSTSPASLLTPREQEVLVLIAQDYSYRSIAHILHVSPGTVRAHVASIYRKADAHSKPEALQWAKNYSLLQ